MTAPRFAFVLGTGRCGSTLLHEIVARHPDVGFVSNLDDRFRRGPRAGRWNNPLYRRVPVGWTRKGRLRFAPSEAYDALERYVSPVLIEPSHDLTAADATPWLVERLRRYFAARAATQGRALFLHKLTGWPRAGLLDAAFPDARFVHVIRDGRAVASSFLQMPWWSGHRGPEHWTYGTLDGDDRKHWEAAERSQTVLAGLCWKILVEAHEEARAALAPGRWLDVRYEDLLAEPDTVMTEVLGFLGLDPDRRFDRALARYRLDPGRAEAFRADLGSDAVAAIERAVADPLRRYAYLDADGPRS